MVVCALRTSRKGRVLAGAGVLLAMICAASGSTFMCKEADEGGRREGVSKEACGRGCKRLEAAINENAHLKVALKEQAEIFNAEIVQTIECMEAEKQQKTKRIETDQCCAAKLKASIYELVKCLKEERRQSTKQMEADQGIIIKLRAIINETINGLSAERPQDAAWLDAVIKEQEELVEVEKRQVLEEIEAEKRQHALFTSVMQNLECLGADEMQGIWQMEGESLRRKKMYLETSV
ncbi:uncharacterized protein NEMAJ01_2275 [Nematocida major]|uniref:uncharacterized protein n=1 Tax=Nematocida major TaxID=1912982 RepID=UPI002007949B|nr:uncharacterized protein NEMAJ01_2275 [Nematocida major]KAH9387379.1 hypothetical protein NEMAJ01_2275 [Nematocida major]